MLLHFLRNRRRWPNSNSSSSSAAAVAATSIIAAVGSELGAAARMRAVEDVRRRLSGVQGRRGLLGTLWDEAVCFEYGDNGTGWSRPEKQTTQHDGSFVFRYPIFQLKDVPAPLPTRHQALNPSRPRLFSFMLQKCMTSTPHRYY
ncbi:hypothetical protein V8E52_011463 [Russula decolorans]